MSSYLLTTCNFKLLLFLMILVLLSIDFTQDKYNIYSKLALADLQCI